MSGSRPWLVIVCTALAAWFTCTASAQDVDYYRDIVPIFAEHCYECHGPQRVEGGLSLYTYDRAMAGGDSGAPILGGTVDTNEILRRINHADPDERMPLESPPLDQEQIDVLTRWVEQGTPWEEQADAGTEDELLGLESALNQWVVPYWPLLLMLLVAVVVIERLKAGATKREADEAKDLRWYHAAARRVGPAGYLVVLLCVVVAVLIDQVTSLSRELERANSELSGKTRVQAVESVFWKPAPTPAPRPRAADRRHLLPRELRAGRGPVQRRQLPHRDPAPLAGR